MTEQLAQNNFQQAVSFDQLMERIGKLMDDHRGELALGPDQFEDRSDGRQYIFDVNTQRAHEAMMTRWQRQGKVTWRDIVNGEFLNVCAALSGNDKMLAAALDSMISRLVAWRIAIDMRKIPR